ncbi:MAG: YhcH/YjgK/YiaL family protein [Eubacteriales bacterium]|nr:YhcH/YjgK/YiaL family protein [Eubacteriales bacterium]
MIIDSIDNIMFYQDILPNLKAGMAALNSKKEWKPGRYEFEGGYFMIQEGVTKPMEEGSFETHRKYIDVQILLKGCEELAWKDCKDLTTVVSYNAEKDQERLNGSKDHVMLISEGMFYAVFPQDGHKAISHTDNQHSYFKVVMKLPVKE